MITLISPRRNLELVLLAFPAFAAWIAWQSLATSRFEMPSASDRMLAQFLISVVAGHLGLRFIVPRAAAQPFAIAAMLCAVGAIFVMRLEPELAQDFVNWFTLGVVVMVVLAFFGSRPELLRSFIFTSGIAALAILGLTAIFGDTRNGARLWIDFGEYSLQTTELIKLGLVVFLSGYLADYSGALAGTRLRLAGRTYSWWPELIPLAAVWLAMLLALAWLRDLGTAALFLLLAIGMLHLATGRIRYWVLGVLLIGVNAVVGYLLFGHVQTRVDAWLNPFENPEGIGYQTAQALFALQAGGVTGEGIGLGTPDVVPAAHTDYIFTAIGEELGLIGALAVVLLFALFIVASFRIAYRAEDDFLRLLASAIGLLIGLQALIIIAGNVRLMPTTGVTLPFVSYGGSSLIVNLGLVGLLLGVSNRSSAPR